MVHKRKRLALGFEAGDDLLGVHPRLNDLKRHATMHGLMLFGDEDQAKAALANLLHQLVTVRSALQHARSRDAVRP